ncbi:MAG: 30S ribosomal protein S4 [Rikenellaceae bacterium]
MGRYIGPKTKISRRFGEAIFGTDTSFDKKNYPPGQHGMARKRKKVSEYGVQLNEKQKAKMIYGVQEKQFRRAFEEAARVGGITGENLIKLLERRLDNVVYRLGIAPTRAAARQLVSHRHITVNGGIVNIASYRLKVGDVIGVREKSKSLEVIQDSLSGSARSRYSWTEWDSASMTGRFLQVPERSEIPENIQEQLIVELYSK